MLFFYQNWYYSLSLWRYTKHQKEAQTVQNMLKSENRTLLPSMGMCGWDAQTGWGSDCLVLKKNKTKTSHPHIKSSSKS